MRSIHQFIERNKQESSRPIKLARYNVIRRSGKSQRIYKMKQKRPIMRTSRKRTKSNIKGPKERKEGYNRNKVTKRKHPSTLRADFFQKVK